jgi:hypothetical protein
VDGLLRQPESVFSQGSILFIQNYPCCRLQQDRISRLELVGTQHKNAIALIQGSHCTHALNLAVNGVVQIEAVTCILFIQDNQVNRNMTITPIREGLQGLGQQSRLTIADAHQHDRVVARDPERPQAG